MASRSGVGGNRNTGGMVTFDIYSWLSPTATVLAAGIGAFVAGRFGLQTADRRRAIDRRHEAADACISALLSFRDLAGSDAAEHDRKTWANVTSSLYDALADSRFLLPKNMRHLPRSVRMALGEGFGLPSVEQDDSAFRVVSGNDILWRRYALDYVEVAIDAFRWWRDSREPVVSKASTLNFDAWLSITGRYQPVDGPWRLGRY